MGGRARFQFAGMAAFALLLAILASIATPSGAHATVTLPAGLNFGVGNNPGDLSWMTSSGVPWRYRYCYLAGGVNTGSGWETWNSPAGQYAAYHMSDRASPRNLPVFSYYEMLQSEPSTGSNDSDRGFPKPN